MLMRKDCYQNVISVYSDMDALQYGRIVYGSIGMCADAIHLPFRKQCFDTVVSGETLEHIKDQKVFLDNIKHALKREGVLILSTPNKMYTLS